MEIYISKDEDNLLPPPSTSNAQSTSVPHPSLFLLLPSHHVGPSSHLPDDVLVHGLVEVKANLSSFRDDVRGELRDIHCRKDEITHLLKVIFSHLLPPAPSSSSPPPLDS